MTHKTSPLTPIPLLMDDSLVPRPAAASEILDLWANQFIRCHIYPFNLGQVINESVDQLIKPLASHWSRCNMQTIQRKFILNCNILTFFFFFFSPFSLRLSLAPSMTLWPCTECDLLHQHQQQHQQHHHSQGSGVTWGPFNLIRSFVPDKRDQRRAKFNLISSNTNRIYWHLIARHCLSFQCES